MPRSLDGASYMLISTEECLLPFGDMTAMRSQRDFVGFKLENSTQMRCYPPIIILFSDLVPFHRTVFGLGSNSNIILQIQPSTERDFLH